MGERERFRFRREGGEGMQTHEQAGRQAHTHVACMNVIECHTCTPTHMHACVDTDGVVATVGAGAGAAVETDGAGEGTGLVDTLLRLLLCFFLTTRNCSKTPVFTWGHMCSLVCVCVRVFVRCNRVFDVRFGYISHHRRISDADASSCVSRFVMPSFDHSIMFKIRSRRINQTFPRSVQMCACM